MTFQQWYMASEWLHLSTTQTALLGGLSFFIAVLVAFAIAAFFKRFSK